MLRTIGFVSHFRLANSLYATAGPLLVGLLSICCLGCSPAGEMAGPPGEEKDGYFEAKVFFATDRAVERQPEIQFTGARGNGALTYGHVTVSIPDSHEVGEIEAPNWWNFSDRDNPSKYVLVQDVKQYEGFPLFQEAVSDLLGEAGREDVLLFVHGYRTTFTEAAQRTAQLAYDLRYPGVPMFYSWPSRGEFARYPADEASVEWSLPHFQTYLRQVLSELGTRKVHVIAHSMGNRALLRALRELDASDLPPGSAELHQIVLAAPDIDVGVFRQLASHFPGKAKRITLYSSSQDKAILASREFHDAPRAGGSIVVVEGVDTIDATQVETSFVEHSYFGDSILPDLHALIANDLPPESRFGLRPRDQDDGRYWELVPGAFEQ